MWLVRIVVAAYACLSGIGYAATRGWNQTGAGPYDYAAPANWVGGAINGIWDVSLTNTASQTVTFGADTILATPLAFGYAGNYDLTLCGTGAARRLTLGGDVSVAPSSSRTVTFGSATASQRLDVDLGGVPRTLSATSGRNLSFLNSLTNGAIAIAGSGPVKFSGAGGGAPGSDVTVGSGAVLQFDSSASGVAGAVRALSVTLSAGTLSLAGNAGTNSVDALSGTLTIAPGAATVTLTPSSARNAALQLGGFSRQAGGLALFRGTALGVSALVAAATNTANVRAAVLPVLAGTGTVGTTVGIVPGAYGDTNAAGSGAALATWDGVYGVRLLNPATEYAPAIVAGQTQRNNVLLVGASGSPLTNTIGSGATINSLSLLAGGAGTNSGVTVTSAVAGATLRIGGGVIFANQSVAAPVASDALYIGVPALDFNGQEGIVVTFTRYQTGANGMASAPLQIDSAMTNANGLTIGGSGELLLAGASTNAYTGATTLTGGELVLGKTVANATIPGDLNITGGTVIFKSSEQIADTGSIALSGGSLNLAQSLSTGSASSETVSNFAFTGGSMTYQSGRKVYLVINGSAKLFNGILFNSSSGSLTVGGQTVLAGGRLRVTDAYDASSAQGTTTLNGSVLISNTVSGVYTAIVVNAGGTAGYKSGKLLFAGDVTCAGNAVNSNAVCITAGTGPGDPGIIALAGTRLFDIADGAAEPDLFIAAPLVDGTDYGALVKAGSGTLALAGVNSYTGPTIVSNGMLSVMGGLASSVTVCSNAVLGGTGWIATNGLPDVTAGTGNIPGVSPQMFGVNLSGGEFGSALPGTYGSDYTYPTDPNEWDYYHRKCLNLIRVPFKWERVQRSVNGALDATELGRLDSVLALAHARRMKVVLDMHNYDRRTVSGTSYLVGSTTVPNTALKDVWHKLADHYKAESAIYGYGIMNEPHDTGGTWPQAAQAAVDGIREVDATNYILMAGDSWSSAPNWPNVNTNLVIADPCGKTLYEAHCYFDHDASGTYKTNYDADGAYANIGVDRATPFVQWLQANHARGVVGEYGVPTNDVRWLTVLNNFLAYLNTNGVSGTYWAGGPWWGSYALSCEPTAGFTVDQPQMSVLKNYTGSGAGAGNLTTAVTINRGGTLAPGVAGIPGTLTIAGDVAFADGGVFRVCASGASTSLLAVNGNVTGSGTVLVSGAATNRVPSKILTAASIAPAFASGIPGFAVVKRNGGTELWFTYQKGTVVFSR